MSVITELMNSEKKKLEEQQRRVDYLAYLNQQADLTQEFFGPKTVLHQPHPQPKLVDRKGGTTFLSGEELEFFEKWWATWGENPTTCQKLATFSKVRGLLPNSHLAQKDRPGQVISHLIRNA